MSLDLQNKALRLVVQGRVQGVGYRLWLQNSAREFGVNGWVRNVDGDRVEAMLCGAADVLDDLVTACRKGPMLSRVDHVHIEQAVYEDYTGFTVEPSVS